MLVFYALDERNTFYMLCFAGACALGSIYGFLQCAWPFGVVEAIRAAVAARRWWSKRRAWQGAPRHRGQGHRSPQLEKRIDALAGRVRVGLGQEGPNEVAEVEFDGPPPAVARLEGLAVQRRKGRPLRGPPEGIYLRCKTFETHAVAMEKATALSKEERLTLLQLLKKLGKGADHQASR
jgi:hypothetical protein